MTEEFIAASLTHRISKVECEQIADFLISSNKDLTFLLKLITSDKDSKETIYGCWLLDKITVKYPSMVLPHLSFLLAHKMFFENESKKRPFYKIIYLICVKHLVEIPEKEQKLIIEFCFDVLISNSAVASKAFAIKTLDLLGNYHPWIYDNLIGILQKDIENSSAGFQSIAKKIIKKNAMPLQ